jgi:clan AA aspartic protease (TIGR02281 family)
MFALVAVVSTPPDKPQPVAEREKKTESPEPTPPAVPPEEGTQPLRESSPIEVVLQNQNGVLYVPVLINNQITLKFVLDSGASDVSIPIDVVSTLIRTGTLAEADLTGTTTHVLADGREVSSMTFRIRSLKVGDVVLENVSGSDTSANGHLLLGQSFLRRFKSWSIDNERQVLVLPFLQPAVP